MAETSKDILAELRTAEGHQGYAGTMITPASPELVRTFHHVKLDNHGLAGEVSASLTFKTTWRGAPCLVVMDVKTDRNTRWSSQTNGPEVGEWRPWRAYASSANEIDETSAADPSRVRSGKGLTDLARRRLSEALEEVALEYIGTPEYVAGRRSGLLKAIDPEYSRQHYHTPDSIARDIRNALRHNSEWLTAEDVLRGELLAAAYVALDEQRARFVGEED